MNNRKSWHVLYTKPNCEKRIAEYLTRKKIDNYCPLNKVTKHLQGKKKAIEQPLFQSYVFVNATSNDLLMIKQIDGVLNLVYWLGKPAVIQDIEISSIKEFLKFHSNVELERISIIADDVHVSSTNQIYMLDAGAHEQDVKLAKLLLPSFGYALVANVEVNYTLLLSKDSLKASPNLNFNNLYNGSFR